MTASSREAKTVSIAWIILGLIILYGTAIRFVALNQTQVQFPIRADAYEYFHYVKNLSQHSIYSKSDKAEIRPDNKRPPGFPWFASLFYNNIHNYPDNIGHHLYSVFLAQTCLQITAFALLTILVAIQFNAWAACLLAVFLWTFPHFVTINHYYLTESLFTSLLALSAVALSLAMHEDQKNKSISGYLLASGLLLGACALVRSTMEYYPFYLALLTVFMDKQWRKRILLIMLPAFCLVLLWKIRSWVVLTESDSTLMINAIFHGSYPGFMYQGKPESFGFPYRFDPDANRYYEGLDTTLSLIWERAKTAPMEYLNWYLWGKIGFFWQWSIISGQGGAFIYPVEYSPYLAVPDFTFFYHFHWKSSWIWVWSGFFLSLFWHFHFIKTRKITLEFLLASIILYASLLHIIVAPFPRYGIPFKVLLLILIAHTIRSGIGCWKEKRQPS